MLHPFGRVNFYVYHTPVFFIHSAHKILQPMFGLKGVVYIAPYNMCFEHELVMQINYSELLYGVSCSARMLERVIPRKYARREVY